MKAWHGQRDRRGHGVIESREIRRDEQPGLPGALGQLAVRVQERGAFGLVAIEGKRRLVELDPGCAGLRQLAQDIGVHREQRVEQREPIEYIALRLGEQQERDRTDEYGPRVDAEGLRFLKLHHRLVRRELERLTLLELRN